MMRKTPFEVIWWEMFCFVDRESDTRREVEQKGGGGGGCGVTCGTRHTLGGVGQTPDILLLLLLCHIFMQTLMFLIAEPDL